jgi:hypothetical protein
MPRDTYITPVFYLPEDNIYLKFAPEKDGCEFRIIRYKEGIVFRSIANPLDTHVLPTEMWKPGIYWVCWEDEEDADPKKVPPTFIILERKGD